MQKKLSFLRKYLLINLLIFIPIFLILLIVPSIFTYLHKPGVITKEKYEYLMEIKNNHNYIAHRGFFDINDPVRAENTLPSFLAAQEQKLAFELDVHLTKDKKLIVFHDSILGLNAIDLTKINDEGDKKLINTPLYELTYDQITALTTKYQLYKTNNHIPLLSEVFTQSITYLSDKPEQKTFILIEIKADGTATPAYINELCQAVNNEIKQNQDAKQILVAVQSFHPKTLAWFKNNNPQVLRGFLSKNYLGHKRPNEPKGIVGWMLGNLYTNFMTRPDFIAYEYKKGVKESWGMRQYRRLYQPVVFAWTIKDNTTLNSAKQQVDGFIFDSIGNPKDYIID